MTETAWPHTRRSWERLKAAIAGCIAAHREYRAIDLIGKALDADLKASIAHMRELVETHDAAVARYGKPLQPDTGDAK